MHHPEVSRRPAHSHGSRFARHAACAAVAALATMLSAAACGAELPATASPPGGSPPGQADPPPVLLVSIDGFRWDYLERYAPPNLLRIATEGVRAESLIPVFPTKTFTNLYTLVTGLYPEHHGIVANTMYDPRTDAWFSLSERAALQDGRWWEGEPIWVTAARQGLKSAILFWPGSEAEIAGHRPTYWLEYDVRLPGGQRVDRVLAWLDLPASERPSYVSLYFSEVDGAGHRHGPESDAVAEAVRRVDSYLGRLLEGLERRGLSGSIQLIVVSDHGMAATSRDRVIVLEDHLDPAAALEVGSSPVYQLFPRRASADEIYARLRDAHPHLQVYRREELPERLHYRTHPRIAPVVVVADEGWSVVRDRDGLAYVGKGEHGYDPAARSMHGILLVRGPAFRRAATVPAVANIHLYALMAQLLDIEPAPNDGQLETLRAFLK